MVTSVHSVELVLRGSGNLRSTRSFRDPSCHASTKFNSHLALTLWASAPAVGSLPSGPSANQLPVLQVTPRMGRKNWIPSWRPQAAPHLRDIETFIPSLPVVGTKVLAAIILQERALCETSLSHK